MPQRTDSEIELPWGKDEPVLIVVSKTCQTLQLYHHGVLMKTYPVVFGSKPGRKLYQGDRRTPTGLYAIIDKDPHPRWGRFLLIDYPSEEDFRRYRQELPNGKIPHAKRGGPGIGGAIGIHGSDRAAFNRAGINWTLGCISLLNSDIKELDKLAPLGTLVYIHD
ncbi:MAG: murein L,D-transpeptidase family protein [Candidatus Binatia bacterium]